MFKELMYKIRGALVLFAIAAVLIVIGFAPVIFDWSAWWLFLTITVAALVAIAAPTLVYMLAMMQSGGR